MANTSVACQEIRFNVADPDLTHVYVLYKNMSNDGMLYVGGWRHKVFPASKSVLEIIQDWKDGKENPFMWDFGNPPN